MNIVIDDGVSVLSTSSVLTLMASNKFWSQAAIKKACLATTSFAVWRKDELYTVYIKNTKKSLASQADVLRLVTR